MRAATVFLVSSDSTLAESARGAVSQIEAARLKMVSAYAELEPELDEIAVVLAPVQNQADADQVARWLTRVITLNKPIATLLICDRQHSDLALPLLRLGAVDSLSRPLDLGRLAYVIDMLTMRVRLAPRQTEVAANPGNVQFLGADKSYLFVPATSTGQLLNQVTRIAPLETHILLHGETGTGKTRLARLIHELSPRCDLPFLVVNAGALSSNVIESEMFGHVRGAFTSADRDRVGKFAEAGAGTILLDDIDALPLDLQAKLLRVVEERMFEPVGSNRSQPMKARLIVASNRLLSDEVAAGRLRSDLYYRLCVVSFFLPPLRENLAIIANLALKFLDDFNHQMKRRLKGISPDALQALQDHAWPGNIRELRNVMERAVALSLGDVVDLQDLPPEFSSKMCQETVNDLDLSAALKSGAQEVGKPSNGVAHTLADAKQSAEATRIAQALARNNNNRLRAAAELGISRGTLYNKMHVYGLMDALPA